MNKIEIVLRDKSSFDRINWEFIQEGVTKYCRLASTLNDYKADRPIDMDDFQKKFNGFYRLRQRAPIFYITYYGYLFENIANDISFEECLDFFLNQLNQFQPSFSSKLIHSLNPRFPIWDKVVLKNLGLPQYFSDKNIHFKREKIILNYNRLQEIYEEYSFTGHFQEMVALFNSKINDQQCKITDMKKIDFMIWQIR